MGPRDGTQTWQQVLLTTDLSVWPYKLPFGSFVCCFEGVGEMFFQAGIESLCNPAWARNQRNPVSASEILGLQPPLMYFQFIFLKHDSNVTKTVFLTKIENS